MSKKAARDRFLHYLAIIYGGETANIPDCDCLLDQLMKSVCNGDDDANVVIPAALVRGAVDAILDEYSLRPHYVSITADEHTTVTVKRGGGEIAANSKVFNGNVLTITATAASGYTLGALTVNGEAFTSGDTITVGTEDVAIVASSSASE